MLIRFVFENFKSFATGAEVSFVATRGGEHPEHLIANEALGASLLPVVGLWGANASGKTNALDALTTMARCVWRAPDPQGAPAPVPYQPFKLRAESREAPTVFDCEFILEGIRYRYGFAYTATRFEREWLHAWPKGTRQVWFERNAVEEDGWYFGPAWHRLRQRAAAETPGSTLFLTSAAQRNHKEARAIWEMFGRWVQPRPRLLWHNLYPRSPLFAEKHAALVRSVLRGADLGVCDFRVMNMRTRILEDLRESGASISVDSFDTMFPERGDPLTLQLGHESADGATIWLEPDEESDGTTALINRLHGVLSALDLGDLLILDEFDLGLHPNLLPLILGLFTDRRLNPRSAQLLFTAHQTALMTQLRRDEVVVVEKLRHGESKLASIAEYRALKREDMERYYRAGRYGGVPRLGAIDAGMSAGAPAASPPAEAGAR